MTAALLALLTPGSNTEYPLHSADGWRVLPMQHAFLPEHYRKRYLREHLVGSAEPTVAGEACLPRHYYNRAGFISALVVLIQA